MCYPYIDHLFTGGYEVHYEVVLKGVCALDASTNGWAKSGLQPLSCFVIDCLYKKVAVRGREKRYKQLINGIGRVVCRKTFITVLFIKLSGSFIVFINFKDFQRYISSFSHLTSFFHEKRLFHGNIIF